MSTTTDKPRSESQAIAQAETIVEMVRALETAETTGAVEDRDDAIETAREAIQEDALSVEVRSGWVASKEDMEPAEFCILLCTGGPAVRIFGELDRGEPSRAWIEHQDWGTPWTRLVPLPMEMDTLLTYCHQFYFGE